jgi:Holliday junction DNA helicase RuvA
MYSDSSKIVKNGILSFSKLNQSTLEDSYFIEEVVSASGINHHEIMNDTIMACKELGFKEDKVIPIAQKILGANLITKPEQLIHLVLKEL